MAHSIRLIWMLSEAIGVRVLTTLLALLVLSFGVACSDDDDPNSSATGSQNGSEATSSGEADANRGIASSVDNLPDLIDEVRASVVAVVVGQGEGSGVVWSSGGNIVTNNHVIQDADSVEVVLASGERLPATVVAADPLTDLAVLEVEGQDLTPATFSEQLPRVGSLVVAIGNPLGFESSVTLGIVSGLNRAIPSGGANPALVDLVQTDAAISPGNSGGALIDVNGEVVGVNVAYIPPEQRAVSLGFAIPAVTVTSIVEQLLEDGTVEHSFLGIEPRPLTPQIASQLGLEVTEGVLVFSLTPGGPAETAGMQPGDVIVDLDEKDVASIEDLYAALRDTAPGDSVSVTVVREGAEQTLDVTLQSRPDS